MLLEWAVLLVFPALMVFAGAIDLFTMTIPNRVSIGLVVAFACLAPFAGFSWEAIGLHAAVGAGVLAVTIGMFAAGWIGGGDAKIFAAASLWMGPAYALDFALVTALCGGALALAVLALRGLPLPAGLAGQAWVARLHNAAHGVPYGVAISAAALIVYPDTAWMRALA